MSKNLITGGMGFVGCYLARQLVEMGEGVVILDIATGSKLLDDIKDRLKIVRGDITNWAHLLEVVESNDIDCIYHLGALLPPVSEENLSATFAVNVVGTVNVLEAARLLKVDSMIFLSTIATYGSGLPSPVSDEAAQQPTSMYGSTKVCCERLGEQYHRRYGVNFRAVRFPAVLGAGRSYAEKSAFCYLAIRESVLGRPYTIYVEKKARVPVVYIKDAVQCLISLKQANESHLKRRIYNILGFYSSHEELVQEVREHIPEAQLDYEPDPAVMDVINNWPTLDDTRARQEWGWQPRYQLAESVADFIAEVRANPAIYQ